MDTREPTKARACMECSSAGGLPLDVWEHIRGFMTMKEWARVAGTCRCLWNLPLSRVDISRSMTPKGIQWAAKRWHSASVASLPHACELDLRLCQTISLEVSRWRVVLRNLRHLSLQDRDTIWLHIPADVAWEDVRLEAFDVLAISFQDVARFGLHWNGVQCGGSSTLTSNNAERDDFGEMCPIQVSCND
ncbi:hypothetical protein COCOBI_14-4800 [Coccomyxa sp. Obi]|nr:hypothetical protein COCOBI_14-4800 [Coccomyxa sp. Obi]